MEPKFRAFVKDKKSIYGVKVMDWRYGELLVENDDNNFYILAKDVELLQFTGLKDRNGVEIYEGHILQYYDSEDEKYFKAEVKWSNDYASWFPLGMHNAEVIGTIQENPKLLKEE